MSPVPSASTIAFIAAASAPTVPASPAPFTPSGLSFVGTGLWPTLKSQNDAKQSALETGVRADPLVKAVLERWPGAEITGVRGPKDALSETLADAVPLDDSLPPADDDTLGENWVRDDGIE